MSRIRLANVVQSRRKRPAPYDPSAVGRSGEGRQRNSGYEKRLFYCRYLPPSWGLPTAYPKLKVHFETLLRQSTFLERASD